MSDNQAEIVPEQASEHGVVVFLVDDQAIIGEAVRRMLAPNEDITFHFCQDPTQALDMSADIQPTVILQDLIMPGIDGLDLVREYRQRDATQLTPLIVLSSKEEADTKAEAFARGANDYIVKLPDPVELIARIRYHSRGYIAMLERNEAHEALEQSEMALRDELSKAATYVRSLLPEPVAEPLKADWRFIPSASLGGDAFDYQWLDDDHFALSLLDVCGHGVGPALLSISVLNVLRSRSLPDTDFRDPARVLSGLNAAFQMSEHRGMFFTMWYAVFCPSRRQLTYAGAGHPPSLLARAGAGESNTLEHLESDGLIVGITPESEYVSTTCAVEPGDRLYLYSDGVFEVPMAENGQMWGIQDFFEFMSRKSASASKIDDLLAHARSLQGSDDFGDDFSMVEFTF